MKVRVFTRIASLLLLSGFSLYLPAQGVIPQLDNGEKLVPENDSIGPTAFRTANISNAFTATSALLGETEAKLLGEEKVSFKQDEVDRLFSVIDDFLYDSTVLTLVRVSMRELSQIELRAGNYVNDLDQMGGRFSREETELEELVSLLDFNSRRWEITLDTHSAGELSEARQERINRILHRLDSMDYLLQEDLQLLLAFQDRFADEKIKLERVEERVKQRREEMSEQFFVREQPGFIKALGELRDSALISRHKDEFVNTVESDLAVLRKEYSRPLGFFTVLLVLLLVLTFRSNRMKKKLVDTKRFPLSDTHTAMLHAPMATVVFLVAMLIRFTLPDLPATAANLNTFILIIPMAHLLIRTYGTKVRVWILVLMGVYTLSFIYDLSYYPDILLRLIQLFISLSGIWLFIWLLKMRPIASTFKSVFLRRLFRLLYFVFLSMEILATLAGFAGHFQLAEFMAIMPITLSVLALAIILSTRLADTLIYLLLASNYFQGINVIRDEFKVIHRKVVWGIDFFLWIFFITSALRITRLKESVFEWGSGILNDGMKIGAVNVTLGSILLLIFVMWLSVMISRITSHVLEKDVFVRVKMAKGVPSTIILLLRIVLISAGFFLAMAAAGMKLTNLSIVLGAFSVGIGFGLQNIFNNMVSGLILAFERPLKVGDVVQVGELIGEVRSIGLRSSTVRTFDGAEVIVPNGNLISQELINWTLSDSSRRMDIRVGVAYGTDPEIVIEMMKDVADKNERVQNVPAPEVLFSEFGDSALEFRLLAWVHMDFRLGTESQLKVELNKRLNEAGIVIPFPQRDVHLYGTAEAMNVPKD